MGCSNVLTGVLNFVTLVLSIPVVGVGIWLAKQHNTVCVRFLQWPIILLGVFILAVSVAGLLGAWCRVSCLLWVYLFVMFVLILLLFVFTIFAFAVTNAGAGQVLSGKGYKEYRLGDYSTWLQRKVNNPSYWETIKSCLSDGKVCNSLDAPQYSTIAQFNAAPLSPVQSGCCKPPSSCGYTFINATNWQETTPPPPSASAKDPDCALWSNAPTELCFNCTSCKAGVLQDLKQDWRKVAIANIIMLVFLIATYSIGCCAFRNNRRDGGGGFFNGGRYGKQSHKF
ncbi:unnamed protein product [Sphagnum jensenii]|uniref:Tetraspanin-8 n=1 Tax=Sphagnum jensenii TaxID=128206 RepID=A0ABP1ACR5_9BRYO